jgi:hypothetical protein
MTQHRLALLTLVLPALLAPARAADPPKVRELRTQKVGETTYFHVSLDPPPRLITDTAFPRFRALPGWGGIEPFLEIRLLSPDGKARAIYQRLGQGPRGGFPLEPPDIKSPPTEEQPPGGRRRPTPRSPVPVVGLEFVGKVQAAGKVKLVLLYPRESRLARILPPSRRGPAARVRWEEAPMTLDLARAKEVPLPAAARERRTGAGPKRLIQPSVRDDLEGLWAEAQVDHLSRLQGQVSDVGFFGFASEATARKYHVPGLGTGRGGLTLPGIGAGPRDRRGIRGMHELYETTTGAAAIAESLALRRMTGIAARDDGKRTVKVSSIQGIDIAEHPWEKMLAGKKPAPEPLARLVPHDNYYLHFKSIRKMIELSELFDQWGTSLSRAYEMNSRDHRMKQRYEEQLCLKSGILGKTLGPLVIKGVAITGSDAYLREGSDVTIIFHVNNRGLFLAGVEGFLKQARAKFGDALKESKSSHLGIPIESYVTPLREVSLHRALFDDHVVYSNSPVGLRRVLDTYKGKRPRLSDALDFQYMRTIFRQDDKAEDGFLFLSDAFIRQLVGPASKIKEKRRLEALTSLYMLTYGALFNAWETGKLPDSYRTIVEGANLKPEEIPVPEGKPAVWDVARQAAVSEAYNAIHFATPLVELPIDTVTPGEAEQYRRFRLEYLGLWRQYFDPVGMRLALTEGQVKIDTYILPLVQNSTYNQLRRVAGGGTVSFDPSSFSGDTLVQFLLHLSPAIQNREELLGLRRGGGLDLGALVAWGLDPVGNWTLLRVDDSPVYGQLVQMLEREQQGRDINGEEVMRLVFQLPIAVGLDIKNTVTFGASLAALRMSVLQSLPGGLTWGPMEKPYKGVPIVRIQATPAGSRQLIGPLTGRQGTFQPAVYYAMIDGGFYLTMNEKMLHSLIDQAEARKKGDGKTVAVNSSLYLAPVAAKHVGKLLSMYLESQTQQQALANLPLWHLLYRCGVIEAKADASKARQVAYRYLGFVPVSPDRSLYRYDAASGEMVNERHGSLRKPTFHQALADDAPLARVLQQLRSIRADLHFREDGIHTVLTLERGKLRK